MDLGLKDTNFTPGLIGRILCFLRTKARKNLARNYGDTEAQSGKEESRVEGRGTRARTGLKQETADGAEHGMTRKFLHQAREGREGGMRERQKYEGQKYEFPFMFLPPFFCHNFFQSR
jgi:hypothetical protein